MMTKLTKNLYSIISYNFSENSKFEERNALKVVYDSSKISKKVSQMWLIIIFLMHNYLLSNLPLHFDAVSKAL